MEGAYQAINTSTTSVILIMDSRLMALHVYGEFLRFFHQKRLTIPFTQGSDTRNLEAQAPNVVSTGPERHREKRKVHCMIAWLPLGISRRNMI